MRSRAILLSGGMDSCALAYWQRPEFGIFINYGQVCAAAEQHAAAKIAAELGLPLEMVNVELSSLGSGDLSGKPELSIAPVPEWWPFRNQMLVTLAAMRAVALNVSELLIGCVSSDQEHADGTPAFVEHASALLEIQEGGLSLNAPALQYTTVELVEKARVPLGLLMWSHSCHRSNTACAECRGCVKAYDVRRKLLKTQASDERFM